ncbi:MAG TPA: FAD-dependent oxidoreductase [Polyangia bacterium]|jgi:monoamine oxidase|nr:FAD-dependent oxidoreductase [Polyangia bacterium]
MRRVPFRVPIWVVCLILSGACRGRPDGAPPSSSSSDATGSPGTPRVIIVGGGIAGLVSAYELGKRGISAELLEATESWGGRVATAYYGEDTYGEFGMQEMWADNPLLGIARELGVALDDKAESPYSSLVIDGKLVPFVQPAAAAFFESFLDLHERRALGRWMDQAKRLRDRALAASDGPSAELKSLQDGSFADWIGTFALPKRVSEWIRLTLECELATDWRSFSGLSGLVEFGFFLGRGQANYRVRGGNSRLTAALADAIPGRKTLLATVTAIERWRTPDGRTRARVSYLRNQRLETVEAERVILAVPFVRIHQIRIDPPLSKEKWRAISSLHRGQYTVVHLLVDKGARETWQVRGQPPAPAPQPSPFPVLTDGPLGVVYGVVHESPAAQPLEVFSLLIHGAAADAFHMVPRDTKVREILGALDKLWPGLAAHVHSSQVFSYHPAALPVWPPGRSPLDAQARALREPELGLTLAGDYTVSAHSNGAAESGQAAAARIISELAPPSPAVPARSRPAPRPADRPAP